MAADKQEVFRLAEDKMKKAVSVNLEDLASIRSGRASPTLLQKVMVDYYGTKVPLNQVANMSVPEPRLLVITPYDKSSLKAIVTAIQSSDLGINPSEDGTVIRLAIPPLTAERRKDFVKVVKHMAEEGRVAVRNLRRSARHDLEALEREGDVSADEVDRAAKELDRLTASAVADIDSALEHKERELLEG